MSDRILIFDGTNTFVRNFAVNPTMDANGQPIGGIVGTLRSVKFLAREVDPIRIFFVWDGEGGSRKRRGIFAEYKAGRKPRLNRELEESQEDSAHNVQWQHQKTRQLLGHLGVTQIEVDDIEADDAIGYLVGYLDPKPKVLVSSDRDMWQLVSPTTCLYWPTKQKYITTGNFVDETSCPPFNYVLMRAMRGDADGSDNIHGIKGLGEKTIMKIFKTELSVPTDIDTLVENCRHYLRLDAEGKAKHTDSEKRWYQAVIDNRDLVSRNVQLMQLISPIISPQSAGIIRQAADSTPRFSFTEFRLSIMNSGIQITDSDLVSTFKTYQARVARDAVA